MPSTDQPCTAREAVARANFAWLSEAGQYGFGTGDYQSPTGVVGTAPLRDTPWTGTPPSSDCAGFAISYCWKLRRHRPGFNHGEWATVSDDINVNSAIEDGEHQQELFVTLAPTDMPRAGDLLCYPSFKFAGREFIGHVALIADVPSDYVVGEGWHRLGVYQCHGPDGFKPGAVYTDGSHWDVYSHNWSKVFTDGTQTIDPRVKVVRPRERP